jgi:hypothetical protein
VSSAGKSSRRAALKALLEVSNKEAQTLRAIVHSNDASQEAKAKAQAELGELSRSVLRRIAAIQSGAEVDIHLVAGPPVLAAPVEIPQIRSNADIIKKVGDPDAA